MTKDKKKNNTGRGPATTSRYLINAAVRQLAEQLAGGQSEAMTAYLQMMGRLHRYSWRNVLLIVQQYPKATQVAGYGQWRKLGRQVRKGQRAIRILAPLVRRPRKEQHAADGDESDRDIYGFRQACVYDVSQTEGKALPTPPQVGGDVTDALPRLTAWLQARGIAVDTCSLPTGVCGRSYGGRIELAPVQSPAATFATLVHEAAHELLHHTPEGMTMSKAVKETEAEAVAYAVCSGLGLQVGTASSDYLQLYDGKPETLLDRIERIGSTALELLRAVRPGQETDGRIGIRGAALGTVPASSVARRPSAASTTA